MQNLASAARDVAVSCSMIELGQHRRTKSKVLAGLKEFRHIWIPLNTPADSLRSRLVCEVLREIFWGWDQSAYLSLLLTRAAASLIMHA